VNVPVIGQVGKASPERPYLCFFRKLDLVATRLLVVDHDLPMPSGQSSGRGISTGSATLELFDAFSRLLHEIPVDDLPGQELLLYFADLG
jgi:hypothetical protein